MDGIELKGPKKLKSILDETKMIMEISMEVFIFGKVGIDLDFT